MYDNTVLIGSTVLMLLLLIFYLVSTVSIERLATVKHFQSSRPADHHVLSRESLPIALQEFYENSCIPPPALQKMNHLRDDHRDALKFFTDPNHFFEQWCAEMKKQSEEALKKKKKKVLAAFITHCKTRHQYVSGNRPCM